MRRHGARTLFVVVTAASLLACSIVRSLDGFDDDFGKTDATAPPLDGSSSPEGGLDAAGVDAGIVCSPPEIMYTGGVKLLTGPYLYGMAQDGDHLYVVGGAYAGDAAVAGDGGFVLQVNKAPPFSESFVVDQIDQPTAITATSYGVYFAARGSIFRLDPGGGAPTLVKTFAPLSTANTITDLVGDDAGLYATTGLGTASSRLNFLPGADFSGFVSEPYPFAWRVLTDNDWVFVTRRLPDAGPGLTRFDRATALDEGGVGCSIDDDPVLGVGVDGQRIAWGSLGPEFAIAAESTCGPAMRTTEVAAPTAVAVGKRGIFVRYTGSVALYTGAGEKIAGCTYSLVSTDEGILSAKATQSAFFGGDYVYFQTPQRVYRMRVAPQ